MQHLRCENCLRIVVANFWEMVDGETVQTFSSFSLTCGCGALVRAMPVRRPRWRKWSEAWPFLEAPS